jgi:hypothetical protein
LEEPRALPNDAHAVSMMPAKRTLMTRGHSRALPSTRFVCSNALLCGTFGSSMQKAREFPYGLEEAMTLKGQRASVEEAQDKGGRAQGAGIHREALRREFRDEERSERQQELLRYDCAEEQHPAKRMATDNVKLIFGKNHVPEQRKGRRDLEEVVGRPEQPLTIAPGNQDDVRRLDSSPREGPANSV